MSDTDSTTSEYPPLGDVLQGHLTGCQQCQQSLSAKPVPNLNPAGYSLLCDEWFRILREYAQMEGEVNNIVARDEYANEAVKGQPL